jgi:hypothetical protein
VKGGVIEGGGIVGVRRDLGLGVHGRVLRAFDSEDSPDMPRRGL